VDVIKAALYHPPQKPDTAALLIGAGSSLAAIVSALKDILRGIGATPISVSFSDVILAMIGTGLLVAQVIVYVMKKRHSNDDPLHSLAKTYVGLLLDDIKAQQSRVSPTDSSPRS